MKSFIKKGLFGVLMAVMVLVVCIIIGSVMKNNELMQKQEEAHEEAMGELQQLKGKVEAIQCLSVTKGFSSITVQEALLTQLMDSIDEVDESDNQYLQEVKIPITESDVLTASEEAMSYINHWLEELDSEGRWVLPPFFI